jgi:hypothetical protein
MLSIASSRSPDALTASHSIATDKAAIIALFRGMTRYVGRLPPMPGMFPDYQVPVVATLATSVRDPVREFLEVRL